MSVSGGDCAGALVGGAAGVGCCARAWLKRKRQARESANALKARGL
jgi:hypothetical protein